MVTLDPDDFRVNKKSRNKHVPSDTVATGKCHLNFDFRIRGKNIAVSATQLGTVVALILASAVAAAQYGLGH